MVARPHPRRRSAISGSPRVRVEPFTTERTSAGWCVRWRISNQGERPIRLRLAQHPHSQFRTPETEIDHEIPPGAATEVALPVLFNERPGVIVENPFLILTFRDTADWRLLARVRVTAGPRGEPLPSDSVVVTMQKLARPP